MKWWRHDKTNPAQEIKKAYDGDSSRLKDTLVVPSLKSDLPDGKNVIWCSSFQLAWNEFKKFFAGPVFVQGAERVTSLLNQATQSKEDLSPESFYAAAGSVAGGILNRIRKEMLQKFPAVDESLLPSVAEGYVTYAYLIANVQFEHEFSDNPQGLMFRDSKGTTTAVDSFGILPTETMERQNTHFQVRILYHGTSSSMPDGGEEFMLDLSRGTKPYQLVVARIERAATLAETLSLLRRKRALAGLQTGAMSMPGNILLVPNVHFQISHHFIELMGADKHILNPGFESLYVGEALQTVKFKLNRAGAYLESSAKSLLIGSGSQSFVFDRPFLIYMVKRSAEHPFFVMWVDNAELLSRRERS